MFCLWFKEIQAFRNIINTSYLWLSLCFTHAAPASMMDTKLMAVWRPYTFQFRFATSLHFHPGTWTVQLSRRNRSWWQRKFSFSLYFNMFENRGRPLVLSEFLRPAYPSNFHCVLYTASMDVKLQGILLWLLHFQLGTQLLHLNFWVCIKCSIKCSMNPRKNCPNWETTDPACGNEK